MITFNLSVDFEMGWGDLDRVTHDDAFYRCAVGGVEQTARVIDVLERSGIPSTWGIVGACCCATLEEARDRAPDGFRVIERQIAALQARRPDYAQVLFCRETVARIASSESIEVGSHGFMHLLPAGLPLEILRQDVCASVRILREASGKAVASFIPPQNYDWPGEAFMDSGIRFVRHTPRVWGYQYSDPRTPAKFARLWNDLVRPVRHYNSGGEALRLFFLRLDRGESIWDAQLRMIHRLLRSAEGAIFCYIHPHNVHAPALVQRLADLCDVVAQAKDRGRVAFGNFSRELPAAPLRHASHG